MKQTKLNIIKTAIALFNEYGFANVSLQQISRNLNISSGNLTYHFPRREDLMNTVYEYFLAELAKVTDAYEAVADLHTIDSRLRKFYVFQQEFRFFYVDLLDIERAFPDIAKRHYQHIEEQIKGIHEVLLYNAAHKDLQAQIDEDIYQYLARQVWMTVVFWQVQLLVQGKTGTVDEMTKAVWMLLRPYLTPQGAISYKQINSSTKLTDNVWDRKL